MDKENVETKYPVALVYTTANLVICTGPCILDGIWIAGDGANADCQVYDGVSTNDPQKIHLEALSGTTFNFAPPEHIVFHRGVYIVVSAATTKVTIAYHSIPR